MLFNYQLITYYYTIILFSSILVYGWYPSDIPEYCSKNMLDRYIVSLSDEEEKQVSKLLQVQVMIRHGARTPVSQRCWKQYRTNWHNCNISTSLERYHPDSSYSKRDQSSASSSNSTESSSWLIEKHYEENFNGNCILGQLLTEGFEQESVNGDILRSAYLSHNNNNFRLFDTSSSTSNSMRLGLDQLPLSLYSDDMERTLLSGQTVINNMLLSLVSTSDVIRWNIIDYFYDWNTCLSLKELIQQAYNSIEFITNNNSINNIQATNDLNRLWGQGYWNWGSSLDCVMTTVCSGRELPTKNNNLDITDDDNNDDDKHSSSTNMNEELFNRIIDHDEFTYKYLFTYKNKLIAKSIISKVALKIRIHIENLIESYKSPHKTIAYSKFVLFSGHDTNIMPLLASILGCNWDGKRAPYAALVSIEIYVAANYHSSTSLDNNEIEQTNNTSTVTTSTTSFNRILDNQDNTITNKDDVITKKDDVINDVDDVKEEEEEVVEFYFRLLYNGKPQKMPCCKNDLCNLNNLLKVLQSATVDNICNLNELSEDKTTSISNPTVNNSIELFNMEWILSMTFILLLGLLIGASTMFFVTKRHKTSTTTTTNSNNSSNKTFGINQYTAIQTSDQVEIELSQVVDNNNDDRL